MAHEKGTWFSKFGPALITPNDDSNDVDDIPDSRVDVDSNVTLGFTLGYMFTDRIGLEFLGMTPSNHDLRGRDSLSAVGKLADVDVLPPTLILQYHFNEYGRFHPFIGAGINYTLFFDENVRSSVDNALGGNTSLDIDDSYGLALQAGLDYMLNDRWYLNASLWYVDIDADATLTTNGIDRDVDVDIDPWVLFTGAGVKF